MRYLCNDCPRHCGVFRSESEKAGFCMSPGLPCVIRATPHFGEEPCISGSNGAGTIFFTGCNLRCVFCQNHTISRQSIGKMITVSELRTLMLRLRDQGVHNIDLVTPTHFSRAIAEALDGLDLGIPVVWNSSGYESLETLRMLDGLIQIYMPDLKYMNSKTANNLSSAPDYPVVATAAIQEMFRQRGAYQMNPDGILQSGVLIRHLILPGHTTESMDVIDYVAETFTPGTVLFSLMSQYTPMSVTASDPDLSRCVSPEENLNLIHYMDVRNIRSGYWQESDSAGENNIPAFDGSGLDNL